MRRVLRAGAYFRVPDGTGVAPLFNPLDSLSGLPAGLDAGFSVAAGRISARSRSAIHIMPHVTQMTVVLTGTLNIRMKGPRDRRPYTLRLLRHQAALTSAGTYVQLINSSTRPCEVLYIVSPSYVFDWRDGHLRYDDSVTLGVDWASLARNGWLAGVPIPSARARTLAAARVRQNPR